MQIQKLSNFGQEEAEILGQKEPGVEIKQALFKDSPFISKESVPFPIFK